MSEIGKLFRFPSLATSLRTPVICTWFRVDQGVVQKRLLVGGVGGFPFITVHCKVSDIISFSFLERGQIVASQVLKRQEWN